jgi:hypothetical protein
VCRIIYIIKGLKEKIEPTLATFETVHISIMTTRLNLSDDISVFKEEINRLVETKMNDLLSIVKTNVCETIDAKISDVYSKTSGSYDDILYDQDGSAYLTDCYNWIFRPTRLRTVPLTKEEQHIGAKLLTTECKRCFVLVRRNHCEETRQYKRTFIFYIFKHIMIQCIKLSTLQSSYYTDTFEYDAYEHNLSSDALFAFKHFQIGFDHHTDAEMFLGFNPLRDILYTYNTHPEYFQSYCHEFGQMEELSHERQLFNEEKEKFAKEKQEFEQERRNLHEGKQKLAKNQASLEQMRGRINAAQLKISSDLQKLEHDQYLLGKERNDFEQSMKSNF